MGKRRIVWVAVLFIFLPASDAQAQKVAADLNLTAEEEGASINVDLYYTRPQFFGLGRVFIDEPNLHEETGASKNMQLLIEAAVGRFFGKGHVKVGPLAGLDTEGRVIAGSNFSIRPFGRTATYLGYVKLATKDDLRHVTRHRFLFDLNKDRQLYLRMDWKTEGDDHEHFRLGVELHTRVDRLNLPVYLEPFWNFVGSQFGFRVGARF